MNISFGVTWDYEPKIYHKANVHRSHRSLCRYGYYHLTYIGDQKWLDAQLKRHPKLRLCKRCAALGVLP